jgi:hypothetical protein
LFIQLFICSCILGQGSEKKVRKTTLFDTLYTMDIQSLQVQVNLDSLLQNKLTENEHEGIFRVQAQTGENFELPMKVSVRSKSRRLLCTFPPLKFDFNKKALEDYGLRKIDKYKIVTHCLEDEQGEQVLLKEYMIYGLLKILTPISLRAKLLDVEYKDSASERSVKKKAMILESEDEFRDKFDGEVCDCMGASPDSIEPVTFEMIAMFQYMVGNLDMNYAIERNVKFIKQPPGKRWLSFAYDFDFSSIVNAPYAYPAIKDNLKIRPVYLGFKENEQYLGEVKDRFLEKKKEILQYIQDFDLISKNDRRDILQYVRSFYDKIEDSEWVVPYKN